MKIAVIGAKGLPPQQGGIEHYCAEVYPRMVAQGHSVDFYARAPYTNQPGLSVSDFNGVRVINLPCPKFRGIEAFVGSGLGSLSTSGGQYDIIHFHALGPALFSGWNRLFSSAKVVVTCQGLDWQRDKWGNWSSSLIRSGEQMAVRMAHGMIVVSRALQSYFAKTYGRDTFYIPNAPASYEPSDPDFTFGQCLGLERDRYFVFLGRLVPEKCPHLLIQAFQKMQLKGWKLVFVGAHSDTCEYIQELMVAAADNPNIIFAGQLLGPQLAEIVRGAGLFVLPSRLEGLPLAMLEAMQEGVPIVASDIEPHQQLLGSDRGLMFRTNDVDNCVSALSWAACNLDKMAIMAENAQRHVEQYYTWERITQENLRLYHSLMHPADAATVNVAPSVQSQSTAIKTPSATLVAPPSDEPR